MTSRSATHARWRALVHAAAFCALLLHLAASGFGESPNSAPSKPTCAILSDPFAPARVAAVAELVAARLTARGRVALLERNHVDRVLREQQLQLALGADQGRAREELGRVLRADLLIMLRSKRAPGDGAPQLELVISETRRGLRLCTTTIALAADQEVEPAAAAVEQQVADSIDRNTREIRQIIAVPPFVSQDLGYQFDYLKTAYAKLIEQTALQRPGMLVVELAEARAIAREITLAGGSGVGRTLPVYLLGEYRNDGAADARTLTLKLRAFHGESEIGTFERAKLSPIDAAAELPVAAQDLLGRAIGETSPSPVAKPAPETESAQLARRAADFQRLGDWDESLALLEAALLLRPDDAELHHQAVIAAGACAALILPTDKDYTPRRLSAGSGFYLRGLEHLELCLRRVHDLTPYVTGPHRDFVSDFRHVNRLWLHFPGAAAGQPDPLEPMFAEVRARETEILLRIASMRARDGQADEADYVQWAAEDDGLTLHEQYALDLKMLREWKDLPDGQRRACSIAMSGSEIRVLDQPTGRQFIADLYALGSSLHQPEYVAAAESLRRDADAYAADRQARLSRGPASRPSPGGATPAAETGPPDVAFHQVNLIVRAGTLPPDPPPFQHCLPAGDGIDVFWGSGKVFLMKEKDDLQTAWSNDDRPAYPEHLEFDGKYVWIPVTRTSQTPRLLVMDPVTARIWEITAVDGLPLAAPADLKGKHAGDPADHPQLLYVAPLAPGRACIVGSFGRAWVAMVTFDPEKGPDNGKNVRVFHEAREVERPEDPVQRQSAALAFTPTYAVTLTEKAGADSKSRQRILIGRGGLTSAAGDCPLIVDPVALSVQVLPETGPHLDQTVRPRPSAPVVFDGAIYWCERMGTPPRGPADLYRIGFPDFAKSTVAAQLHDGPSTGSKVFFYNRRLYLPDRNWWVADAPGLPFQLLRGEIPTRAGAHDVRWAISHEGQGRMIQLRDSVDEVCPSNHYGLLAFTSNGGGFPRVLQVEFLTPAAGAATQPAQ